MSKTSFSEARSAAYREKLLDPRWQKRRLEILNRDDFTCQHCGEKEKTLHVHHYWYENEYEPWDMSDESLVTLCANCHDEETRAGKEAEVNLIRMLRVKRMSFKDIKSLTEAFRISLVPTDPDDGSLNWEGLFLHLQTILSIEGGFAVLEKFRETQELKIAMQDPNFEW